MTALWTLLLIGFALIIIGGLDYESYEEEQVADADSTGEHNTTAS